MQRSSVADIDAALQTRRGEEVTVVARLPEPELTADTAATRCEALQENARRAQQDVERFARTRSGVSLDSQFWITNAVVLTVETAKTSLEELARVPGIERIHENFEVEAFEGHERQRRTGTDGTTLGHGTYTYGLEQMNVPQVWEQIGTRGEGVKVAVLDTGIDPDHPDIDLYTEDESDPTYPGGWAEFDASGNQISGSEPYDSGSHGTHVSGTVAGGNESDTHIGVAPDVSLLHGLVLPGGRGSFSQIVGGIQWAVDNDADIVNMSLGSGSYSSGYVQVLQNARSAGTLAVSACGNEGEGTSGSPANVYGVGIAVGATDVNEDVPNFASGERIDTDTAWGSAAPSEWPAEYVVPDIAAPGRGVTSTLPGGNYGGKSGTSMATPHVSGVAALMVAASGDTVTPQDVRSELESTAWKPDGWSPDSSTTIDGKDNRYGKGIVDALAVVGSVEIDTGVVGVVERENTAVEGASIEFDGRVVETDESGTFEVYADPGEYDLTISGPGLTDTTKMVTVEDSGSFTDLGTITVDPQVDLLLTDGQPEKVEGGETVEVTFDAYKVETMQVDLTGTYAESDATLTVGDKSVSFGDSVSFDDYTGELTVAVETTATTSGDIGLDHTASGTNTQATVSTGQTAVFQWLLEVRVVDAADGYAGTIVENLDRELANLARVQSTTTTEVTNNASDYDAVVAQNLATDTLSDFVGATGDIGVVYLDQFGTESNAIPQFANVSADVTNTHADDSLGSAVPPVSYVTNAEHPIVDGTAVGDRNLIHEGQYADHTWFDLADDSAFEEIADVAHDAGTSGLALAVDEDSRTVLASTLGHSAYVSDSQFTSFAHDVLASSVEYVGRVIDVSASASYDSGTVQLSIQASWVEDLVVEDIWTDWNLTAVDLTENFEDTISADGKGSWSWESAQKQVEPTVTLELPSSYVGGDFVVTVRASAGERTVETTATITVA